MVDQFTTWYPEGYIKEKYTLDRNGLKTGAYEEYYPNGKPKVEGSYNGDVKEGKWTTWDEKGKKTVEKF